MINGAGMTGCPTGRRPIPHSRLNKGRQVKYLRERETDKENVITYFCKMRVAEILKTENPDTVKENTNIILRNNIKFSVITMAKPKGP